MVGGGLVGGVLLGGGLVGGVLLGGGLVGWACATCRVIEVPCVTTLYGFGLMPITVPGVVPPVAGT